MKTFLIISGILLLINSILLFYWHGKLESIKHRIYMVHKKQAEMYANLYESGEITKEEYDENMEILLFHQNYYLNGK